MSLCPSRGTVGEGQRDSEKSNIKNQMKTKRIYKISNKEAASRMISLARRFHGKDGPHSAGLRKGLLFGARLLLTGDFMKGR